MPNKCRNCGAEDFIPKYINYGFCDSQMGVPVCPSCGSSDIDIGIYCPCCGPNRRERVHELRSCNFTPEEILGLNEIYDGKELE